MHRSVCALVGLSIAGLACSSRTTQSGDGATPANVDSRPGAAERTAVDRTSVPEVASCSTDNPVKILFVVDTSGSMQFVDPTSAQAPPIRQAAVRQVIDGLKNNPRVSFAIVQFNATLRFNGGASSPFTLFIHDGAALSNALADLAQAELPGDYQGALAMALDVLQGDMQGSAPSDLPRTKYVVILLGDGGPSPVCKAGCSNDAPLGGECSGGACGTPDVCGRCDGPPPSLSASFCDLPRDQWCDAFNPWNCESMQGWFYAMTSPCQEYNSEAQLLQQVQAITALASRLHAGQVQLHTARILAPNLPADIMTLFGIDPAASASLMSKIAAAGGGTYLDGQKATIDLLKLDLGPLCK
jgi:hypothetical protein